MIYGQTFLDEGLIFKNANEKKLMEEIKSVCAKYKRNPGLFAGAKEYNKDAPAMSRDVYNKLKSKFDVVYHSCVVVETTNSVEMPGASVFYTCIDLKNNTQYTFKLYCHPKDPKAHSMIEKKFDKITVPEEAIRKVIAACNGRGYQASITGSGNALKVSPVISTFNTGVSLGAIESMMKSIAEKNGMELKNFPLSSKYTFVPA